MKFKTACLWALGSLPILGILVSSCASIHNNQCGSWLGLFAYFSLLPTAIVVNVFPMATDNDLLFWAVFAVVAWAWLAVLIFCSSVIVPKRTPPARKRAAPIRPAPHEKDSQR